MYQSLIEDGRFLADADWLKNRSEWLLGATENGAPVSPNRTAAYNRFAALLGFGPGGYTEAQKELQSDASGSQNRVGFQRPPVGGVSSAAASAMRLRGLTTSEILPVAGTDFEQRTWYQLTPEIVHQHDDLSFTIEAVSFNFWDHRLMPGGPPALSGDSPVYLKRSPGYLVPNVGMLSAMSELLRRLRCPRPWRVTDYRGETRNRQYHVDRISLGIANQRLASEWDFAASEAFARFVAEIAFDPQWIIQLSGLNDEIMDAAYGHRTAGHLVDPRLSRYSDAIGHLQELAAKIDSAYHSQFRTALPFMESARYAAWVLRLIGNDFLRFPADDVLSFTVEAQPYLHQLAVALGADHPQDAIFCWPPNAICLPGVTEGSAIANKRLRKGRNQSRFTESTQE